MSRKRTSTTKPKERAKLDTAEQVNKEIKRQYRRYANGEITAAELKSRVTALQALRAGLSDPIEHSDSATGSRVTEVNIVGIPRNWSVTGLLGREAHMPNETLMQLRELLPLGSIHPPPSLNDSLPPPLPVDDTQPPPLLENDEPPLAPDDADIVDITNTEPQGPADITPPLLYVPLPPRQHRND